MIREGFRRRIRGKGPVNLKTHSSKKPEGEILSVAKTRVITASPTTPVYEVMQTMAKEGFRRLPVVVAGTGRLEGIVTAMDIIDFLGGGQKFEIIQKKFEGNFFKAINEHVRIIMEQKVITASAATKISEAIELMKNSNVGALPIIDEKNRVRGIVTERDITNLFANKVRNMKVTELMSQNVVTVLPKTTVFEAEKMMVSEGFRRLPFISDGKIIAIITAMDILRFFGCGDVFKHVRSGTMTQVLSTPALEIATKEVTTIAADADVGQAARLMREKDIGALPVTEKEKLVGIITERDFFKVIE